MSNSNDGRAVTMVVYTDEDGNGPHPLYLAADELMHYHVENHGDHDTHWVVVTRPGLERARYNVRYLQSIHFADHASGERIP